MSPLLCVLIVVGAMAAGIVAMLLLRRRAPGGSHFNDGDRAAGVFGVLATGFALLLGLVIVLAFNSYDQSRSGAEDEARFVAQQHETAMLLPPSVRADLSAELVCYSREVVKREWPRMEDGLEGEPLNPWTVELFRTIRDVDPEKPSEQAAYSKWLDQTSDREAARSQRIHGSVGVIPLPLWIVLFSSAAVIVLYMLLFADSDEHPFVQGALIGSVILVIVSSLLLIGVLDQPFSRGFGGVRPTAMERTADILHTERQVVDLHNSLPCDATGRKIG